MGNNDNFIDGILNFGKNKVLEVSNSDLYFSFAFGNEIALTDSKGYFILNCGEDLWEEVKKFILKNPTKKEVVDFWLSKSKIYEISLWSKNFDDISNLLLDEK